MKYILGVDAGATKTTAQIVSQDGEVLSLVKGSAASMHMHNRNDFKQAIEGVVIKAVHESGKDIKEFYVACFGVAGIDTEELWNEARRLIADVVPVESNNNLLVYNDIKIVRPACSDKEFGVSVIAGTGSNFYGINEKGKEAYASGLDHLLSDEGSGYWVGAKALRAVVRSMDGRGEKTMLEELVLEKFSIKNARELADLVYEEGFGKREIGEVAKLVDEAYIKDDKVAESILESAASEIALGINAVVRRLGMANSEFDIITVGGMFRSPFPFVEKILPNLETPNAKLIVCQKDPVEGAVRLALQLVSSEKA
ncbi:MAG: BadF/BadG/BcrA/BcrD ATPase family protein [Candidatus Spechtbacterales bacterium]